MINSVGMNSAMSLMSTSSMQRQPPPAENNTFEVANSGSGGQVSAAGVNPPAGGAPSASGSSSDTEEVFDILDINEDGYVSLEEMQGLAASQKFNTAGMLNAKDGGSGMKPPPLAAVSSAYEANNGENKISQLIEQLQSGSENEEYSSLELMV